MQRAALGGADERLAARWHRHGIPLKTARRAIILGCVRKSTKLIDHSQRQPIRSLCYFDSLVAEVREQTVSAAYWRHLEYNLGRCEQYWREWPGTGPG